MSAVLNRASMRRASGSGKSGEYGSRNVPTSNAPEAESLISRGNCRCINVCEAIELCQKKKARSLAVILLVDTSVSFGPPSAFSTPSSIDTCINENAGAQTSLLEGVAS